MKQPTKGDEAMKRTKKDSKGRVWSYCDGEGSWSHGAHVIGCAGKNGSKWEIWGGPSKDYYAYSTLRDAMEACR